MQGGFFGTILKILLIAIALIGGVAAIAWLFPMLAEWAVAATEGTDFYMAGQWVAKILTFVALIAQNIVDSVLDMLEMLGMDMENVRQSLRDHKAKI